MARALIVGSGHPIAAGVIRGWLSRGNEIAEIWASPVSRVRTTPRTLYQWVPEWSVGRLAVRQRIAVFENPPLRTWDALARIRSIGADTLITAVTMQIIPAVLIEYFEGRAVNFHPALLPDYRGPSPFDGPLLDGTENSHSAMTLHVLTAGIDEGPILAQLPAPFDEAGRRYGRWLALHAHRAEALAGTALPDYLEGKIAAVPQQGGSYRRVRMEAVLGRRMSAAEADRVTEKLGPVGRAYAQVRRGRPIAVKGPIRRLGAPSGERPRLGPMAVTLDLADARVSVPRWSPLDALGQRLDLIQGLRSVPQE